MGRRSALGHGTHLSTGVKPDLPRDGIPWRSVRSDYFNADSLNLCWHFLNRKAALQFSLPARKGWLRLLPDTARAHLVQKETDHYYSAVTKVDFNAQGMEKAGLYLSNGNQKVYIQLYRGFDNGKKIVLKFDTAVRSVTNRYGNVVWLKLERNQHQLAAFCSGDGTSWMAVGAPISAVDLDKTQPNYNSWVGTSVGLFAEGHQADFDFFACKDGFSMLPAVGYSNYFGVEKVSNSFGKSVTPTSKDGGWFMLSGVDFGEDKRVASSIEVTALANATAFVEVWLDDLGTGKLIATLPIGKTGAGKWDTFKKSIPSTAGQHDVFVKIIGGDSNTVFLKSVRLSL